MENYTQLGIAGATLTILAFIVKYFVDAQKEARLDNKELTQKFIDIAEQNLEAQNKATVASEKLTDMIYKVLREK